MPAVEAKKQHRTGPAIQKTILTYPVVPSYARDNKPFIELRNISFLHKDASGNAALLRDININIYPGEYMMIFGGSGSGKSVLVNILMGLERPTTGQMLAAGRDLAALSPDELAYFRLSTLGMVYQTANLVDSVNVWQNVAMPAAIAGIEKNKREQLALRILETFNMQELANKMPSSLTRGQKRRVAIARSFVNSPMIILADEPTADLDTSEADEIMETLRFTNEQGNITLIVTTQDPNFVHFSNRVIYLENGRIKRVVENRPLRQL